MLAVDVERTKRGWSKSRLAREAGLNQVTVIAGLNGSLRLGPSQRQRICEALEWPQDRVNDLFEEADAR